MKLPEKATQPTMYFIGVTTTKSSIMKLFPFWAEALGLEKAVLKGIDIDIHADPQVYRDVVQFIKDDELSLGALVTTHKIDLYHAAKDLFDYLDPYATMFGELSSISKKNGRLEGYAKDPISSGLAMEAFIPENYWNDHGGELFIMGAGGSAIAICSYLLDPKKRKSIPSKVVIANRSQPRLDEIARIVQEINPDVEAEYHLTPEQGQNDDLLAQLKPHSLIINSTGLGKDRPGSPLTDSCSFPEESLVWELNYRGGLDFMHQALAQKETKDLYIEDGWIYFIHGWTQVVAEVFHIDITGSVFDRIEQISNETR
ncbi:shikimate dehydrogenase family protein [Peribacillus huizhouensis]|uniref:Shikimate 5-dehydrogenase n=1 Tax=Peribacillus huizhouensis TaxID=1501239 RepID=A0ABR6CN82_9BACI|nr:shikimate dehydrogenase [Peribacillus huizhouensis]MBA9026470.1 shikimate 5-dehydrogenase [Peribacillus huizhouensis]